LKNPAAKIFFDHQIFSLQKVGGISRYFFELMQKLPDSGFSTRLPNLYSDNIFLEDPKKLPFMSKVNPKVSGRVNEYISRLNSKKILRSGNYDIFHPTYYSTYHLSKNKRPLVVTVYDMIHEIYPEQFRNASDITKSKKALFERADQIIAISHKTKEDLTRFFKVSSDKVEVTHLATSLSEVAPKPVELSFKKYILFVGQRKGYKNFRDLAEAFAKIKDLLPDVHLFCAGGGSLDREELNLVSDLKISDRVFQKGVTDAELSWAYSNALCFVFPSVYEGFGIPVLESMSLGTPVILANRSCFPEIARDAGLYFNDQKELSEILEEVCLNKLNRSEVVEKGLILSNEYSWDRVARETGEIYRKLL
jgi:glycosyltransferase involved in cell wall biosynthesis